jgi:hypothetical protein
MGTTGLERPATQGVTGRVETASIFGLTAENHEAEEMRRSALSGARR